MKNTALVLTLFTTAALALAPAPASGSGRAPEIIVDRATSDIFPEIWLTEEISATAEPLNGEEQTRCREIVDKALARNSSAVVGANLKKVDVLGGLKYSGVSAVGTRSTSAIHVVSKARYSAAQVEDIIHAEFSSILLRHFPGYPDKTVWQRINPPDFTYRGSGLQAVRDKQASLRSSDALCEEGFLNEYSKASSEEDFNSYAARVFVGKAALWETTERYPKVKANADLTIAFYGKFDPSFTPEFFASLRQ